MFLSQYNSMFVYAQVVFVFSTWPISILDAPKFNFACGARSVPMQRTMSKLY